MVSRIVEATVSALVVFWILNNAEDFSKVANAASQGIVSSVQALWGRG